MHMGRGGARDIDLHGRQIRPETRRRFEAFMQAYKSSRQGAQETLIGEFGHSYFFYYRFGFCGGDRAPAQTSIGAEAG